MQRPAHRPPAPDISEVLATTLADPPTPVSPVLAAGSRPTLPAEPPARFGRFVLLRLLGEGGMGRVHAAYDEELDRKVALKVLRHGDEVWTEQRAHILREAQAMARLSHPNVVPIFDVGETEGRLFIAMEFVEGGTLSEWRKQSKRGWEETLRLYRAAGEGLLAAHRAGLIHRDFKPDNVLLGRDGRPRVADFGLARAEGLPDAPLPLQPADATHLSPGHLLATPMTCTGSLIGTPAYMSPEQHVGRPADARSDQFSFCAALYEALYNELPFAGDTLVELSANVLAGNVRRQTARSEIPSQIQHALRRGLALQPEQRFPSMAELLEALDVDPRRDPAGAPRARLIFSAIAVGMIPVAGITLTLLRFRARGQLPMSALLAASIPLFLITLAAALVMRRSLLQNAFHRGLAISYLIILGQTSLLRWLGWRLGLTEAQFVPLDMMAMCGVAATVAMQYMRPVWFMVAYIGTAAFVAAAAPAYAFQIAQLSYTAIGVLFLALWIRAARINRVSGASREMLRK